MMHFIHQQSAYVYIHYIGSQSDHMPHTCPGGSCPTELPLLTFGSPCKASSRIPTWKITSKRRSCDPCWPF